MDWENKIKTGIRPGSVLGGTLVVAVSFFFCLVFPFIFVVVVVVVVVSRRGRKLVDGRLRRLLGAD